MKSIVAGYSEDRRMFWSFVVSCGLRCRLIFSSLHHLGKNRQLQKAGNRSRRQSYQTRALYVCPAEPWCCKGEKMRADVPNQTRLGEVLTWGPRILREGRRLGDVRYNQEECIGTERLRWIDDRSKEERADKSRGAGGTAKPFPFPCSPREFVPSTHLCRYFTPEAEVLGTLCFRVQFV